MPGRQLGIVGDPTLLLRVDKGPFSVLVPAIIELPGVLVRPLLGHLMRSVDGARRPVHVEGFLWLNRLVPLQPMDGIVGEILAEVVALLGCLRRQHAGGVAHQVGFVLRRFTTEEPVEVLESQTGRPVLEGTDHGRLVSRGVVPLPERRSGVPVVLQHLGLQRAAARDQPRVAVPVVGELSDLACADTMVVAARQQRRPSRRAHRRGVEAVVPDPFTDEALQGRRVDLPSEDIWQRRARVVDQDDQDVRRIVGQAGFGGTRTVDRLLHRPACDAA